MKQGLRPGHGSIMFGRRGQGRLQPQGLEVLFDFRDPPPPARAENHFQPGDPLPSRLRSEEGMGPQHFDRLGEVFQHEPKRLLLDGAGVHDQLARRQQGPQAAAQSLHLGDGDAKQQAGLTGYLLQGAAADLRIPRGTLGVVGGHREIPAEDPGGKLTEPSKADDADFHTFSR